MSKNNGNLDQNVLKVLLESVKQQNDLLVQILQSQKETSQKETSQKETSQKETSQKETSQKETSQKEIEKIKIISQDQSMKVKHLCQAISKTTGKQCKLTALDSSKFCHVHAKQDPNFDQELEDQIQVLKIEDQIKILGSAKNNDPDRMRVNTDRKAVNFLFSKKRRGFPQRVMQNNFWVKTLDDLEIGERQDILGNRSVKPLITNLSWKNNVKVSDDLSFKIGKKVFKIFWETKKQATEKNQQYFRQYIERIA